MVAPPDVLLRDSLHPAQLAYENESMYGVAVCIAKSQMRRGLPSRYFPILSSRLHEPLVGADMSLHISFELYCMSGRSAAR